jgi:hypothetical protein
MSIINYSFVSMIKGKILIEEEDSQAFRELYFNENAVDGIYIIDSELMGVIINGNEFLLQFNNSIYEMVKNILQLKTLGIN